MTYRRTPRNSTKVFDASQYSGNLPESVDWRTNNAVTSIKDQVLLAHTITLCYSMLQTGSTIEKPMTACVLYICRVNVELAMLLVQWVLWREPMLWLLVPSPLSVSRISSTAQVSTSVHNPYAQLYHLLPLQFPMVIMDARVETCTMHFSTWWPMMESILPVLTLTKLRYNRICNSKL